MPHTEIELIVVNGRSVRFSHRLRDVGLLKRSLVIRGYFQR